MSQHAQVTSARAVPHAMHGPLVTLCTAVLPVWARHLAASRSQSEEAVTEMLSAFSEISPHLAMAARQSRQVSAALVVGEGGVMQLAQACEKELSPLLPKLDANAAAAVHRVIAMVGQSIAALEQVVPPLVHETDVVSKQVDRMYVGFQFQDRINQMMTLLLQDIARLQSLLADPGANEDALASTDWLARLESQYTMAEQHGDSALGAACHPDEPSTGHGEADFF